jgi:voltage-gated potassium channel
VNARAQALERRFEWPMIAAALLTLPAIVLQDSHPHGVEHEIGAWLGAATWLTFALEVVVMLAVVDSRGAWLRSHVLDVAIVVLTPPLVLTPLQGLRLLRIARVLRLLRVFRVATLARRLFTTDGLRYVSVIALLVLVVAAEAFSSAEHTSFGNGIYWALGTMTTAGSGSIEPHTPASKVVAGIVMVVGIGFFAVLTGAIAERFFSAEVQELDEEARDLTRDERELGVRVHDIARQLQELELELRARESPDRGAEPPDAPRELPSG